jgi:phosphatidylinositol glycan class Z
VILRFAWTALPQTGYIHPDEFFQSVEIVAGDVFELNVTRSWEFNASSPVRSIVPLYIVTGLPLFLLKCVVRFAGETFLTWWSVTVVARCTMTLLSLFVDLSVYHMCHKLGGDGIAGLLLVSTSYVTLVFYTRTFSIQSSHFCLQH